VHFAATAITDGARHSATVVADCPFVGSRRRQGDSIAQVRLWPGDGLAVKVVSGARRDLAA